MHQANPILLGQYKTEDILREHIQRLGGTIEDGTELRSFKQSTDRVDAVLVKASKEEKVSCQYLVGADGARGKTSCVFNKLSSANALAPGIVRKQLGLSFLGETRYEEQLMLGMVAVQGLGTDVRVLLTASCACHDKEYVVLAPVG